MQRHLSRQSFTCRSKARHDPASSWTKTIGTAPSGPWASAYSLVPSRAVISVMNASPCGPSMGQGARAGAAIDGDRGAGEVLRVIGGEEGDNRRHLLRLLGLAERLPLHL